MIEDLAAYIFEKIGHSWKYKGREDYFVPEADDVQRVLDKAAAKLYDEPVGTTFEQGGLLIEKHDHGNSVYVYVGDYE